MAAGIPDDVFWDSTIAETYTVLEKIAERDEARERNAALRAGLITSATYNVHRKKGASPLGPEDFVRQPTQTQYVSGEEMRDLMRRWLGPPKEQTQ